MSNKRRIEVDRADEYKMNKSVLHASQIKMPFWALHGTNWPFHIEFIKEIIILKKSIGQAYLKNNKIDKNISEAIFQACDEILGDSKKFKKYFITDQIQDGAGISVNVNEVIVNLSLIKFRKSRGEYYVRSNDIVNMSQLKNYIYPLERVDNEK